MADALPVDGQPQPGDTFIELRGGVPYIGTEPGGSRASRLREYEDVTGRLVTEVRGAFDPKELRDPKTGKWIKDPAGKYLDEAVKELGEGKKLTHVHEDKLHADVEHQRKGYKVSFFKRQDGKYVKQGESVHYQHGADAAEAMRRKRHLKESELKHGKSHLGEGEPQVRTGQTPDGRSWKATITPGGAGSTYEIDAKPGGDLSQYRDMPTRATYLGNGRVKIEHQDEHGNWAVQPGSPAGGWTMESLKSRTRLYQSIAEELHAARVEEEKLRPPPEPGNVPGYAEWKAGSAAKVKAVLDTEPVTPGGVPNSATEHKRVVASQIAERMSGVSTPDMIGAAYPDVLSSLDASKFRDAASNPGKYVYLQGPGGTMSLQLKGPGNSADYKPLTEQVLREHAASHLVSGWAASSNDHNARALAVQEAAVQEFGLKNVAPWDMSPELSAKVTAALDQHGAVYRAFLRAQYDNTQADFKARGIETVNVLRGMSWPGGKLPGWAATQSAGAVIGTPPLRPLSSWTVNSKIASDFAATYGDHRLTLGATVRVEAILSWPRTGFGCLAEYELVIMSSSGKVTVRNIKI